jgi:glucose-6-phosphate 1-dehydrogenase
MELTLEEMKHADQQFMMQDFTIVIFGGAGDLSRKKLLPTLYHLFEQNQLPNNFTVIGCGSPVGMTDNEYRILANNSVLENNDDSYDEEKSQNFVRHLHFVSGRLEEASVFERIRDLLLTKSPKDSDGNIRVVFYLAVPPGSFEPVILKIREFGLNTGIYIPKIIIEKPFGHDLQSADALNDVVTSVFHEHQVYRIDHYLGKETVQNIIFFRFSNSIFEPLWNRRYIDNVQITVAEDIGIESRGKFYEKAGVVRDIVQNHVMQIIALIAMEPPIGFDPELIRDEKVKVFKSITVMSPDMVLKNTVRGQYGAGVINGKEVKGYRSENFVAGDSKTATYFAGKFEINNWRWAGVPFYVRAGKRLAKRVTEIVIEFKQPPLQLFGGRQQLDSSLLVLTIHPEESIALRFGVKYPNTTKKIKQISMNFSYSKEFQVKPYPPYSRLILDSLKGDLTLFVRQDGEEAMWKVIDPIISTWENPECPSCPKFPNYASGTSGPDNADLLIQADNRHWMTDLS